MSETYNKAPLYLQLALQAYQQHVNQSQDDYGKHYHYTEGPCTVPESNYEPLPKYQRSNRHHEPAGNVPNRRQRWLEKHTKPNVGHQTEPPEAPVTPVETKSVACWTFQHGTEEPRCFFSNTKWPKQRRVVRGLPDDKIPTLFRGRTVTVMDRLAEGACVEPAEDAVYCKVCGGLVIVQERHEESRLHQSRLRPDFSKEPFDALVEDMLGNPCAAAVDEEDGDGSGGGDGDS